MISKFKIAIVGIGGVGGYLGGKLAAQYVNSNDTEIIFIARGENANVIRSNGLELITAQGTQTAYPSLVTNDPETLEVIDLIICCVKSYDLVQAIEPFRNCINDKTIILPFLNGLDASDTIKNIFPEANILDGCAYIISKLIAPGVVKVTGDISQFYFGMKHEIAESLEKVVSIFKKADINIQLSDGISQVLCEKFLFISPFATLTSCLDLCLGDILKDKHYKEALINLLTELKTVAEGRV